MALNAWVYRFYRSMAFVGIGILSLIALISVISIVGRALIWAGLGPLRGDFELVEIGSALAIFCFMPWTHLRRAHAVVDLLWGTFSAGFKRVMVVLVDALMLFAWCILIWRMGVATLEHMDTGETTFVLLMPLWWGYACAMIPGALGLLAYAWKLSEALGLVSPPTEYAVEAAAGH